MKDLLALLVVVSTTTVVSGQTAKPPPQRVHGRTFFHQDGTRTESVKNPYTRTLTELTYSSAGVLTTRAIYQINENGQATQGLIYDGRDNLQARAVTDFDSFGNPKESRLINLNGEVFQQTLYEYAADGSPKKPKVINHQVKTPMMKPAVIDFTKTTQANGGPMTMDGGQTTGLPPIYAPGTSPAAGTAAPQTDGAAPKKSFWKRLFSKDKK
jgi:hypothetical protein